MPEFDAITSGSPLLCGILAGALAFAPLALALWPVLVRKKDASMTKGMPGVGISFAVLLLTVVAAYLIARPALVAVAVGELAGFFAGWIVVALFVMVRADS